MLLEEDREEIGTMKPRFSNLDQNVTVSVILLILISALFLIWLIGKSQGNNCISSSPLAQRSDFSVLPTAVLHERRRITEEDYNEIVDNNMLTYNEEETSRLSLEDICDSGNFTCLSDRRAIDNRVRYSTKNKLIGCMATNSMTGILEFLMCYLYDQKTFMKAKNVMDPGTLRSYCQVVSEDHSLPKVWAELSERGVNISEVLQYAVIQDPMERFLDNYLDYGIGISCSPNETASCSGCSSNITCFLEEKTKELLSFDVKSDFHETFFSPQAWFCDFNRHFNEYRIITYDDNRSIPAVLQKIKEISQKNGVNQDDVDVIQVHFDSRQEEDNEYRRRAKEFIRERIKDDEYLMRMFLQLYHVDYIKFGFELAEK